MRVLVVLLILLAGCGAPEVVEPEPTPTPTPRPTPEPLHRFDLLVDFNFHGCHGTQSVAHPSLDELQAVLPPNVTAKETMGPTGPTGQGTLVTELYSCQSYTSPTAETNGTILGKVFIDIEAPTLEEPVTADAYGYLVRMIGADDNFPALWRVAGYDTYNGTWNATGTMVGPIEESTIRAGDYVFDARVLQQNTTATHTFAHITQLADGSHLLWTGTRSDDGSTGIVTASAPDDDAFGDRGQEGGRYTVEFTGQYLARIF